MSTGRIDTWRDGARRSRDLGSVELWERSLARSRQRRRLLELNRRNRRRRKTISVAVTASVAGGPVLPPAVAAAESGPGVTTAAGIEPGAPSQTGSSRVVLEVGSQGPLVAALQRRLNEVLPFSHLAVDGIYGPLTRAAVVDFQRHHRLLADGKVDVGMWARVFDAPVLVFGDAAASGSPGSGSVGSAAGGGSVAARPRAEFASLHRRSGTAREADLGGAATTSTPSTSTRTTGAAATSGGSLVAGGPGSAATGSSDAVGGASSGGPSGGAAPISVVTPTTPTRQFSTYVLSNGVALPLPRQYLTGGYVDQGVDYAAPGGTPEYAMGDGVIIGEGISGFGPNAPILKITSGPLTGLEVYYGHSGSDLVHVGDHVTAGQQITEVGYGIVGISTGPHLEVGFYPPGPMGSGSRMLSVINSLLRQHPTGRVWRSGSSSVHVARDTRSGHRKRTGSASTTATIVTVSSGSGGVGVGPGVSTQPAPAPVSAPAPIQAPVSSAAPASPAPAPTSTPAPAASTAAPAPAPAPVPSDPGVGSTTVPTTPAGPPAQTPAPPVTPTTPTPTTTTPTTTTPTTTTTATTTPTPTAPAPPTTTPTTTTA
ncbi:MAG TPA: peptidoglycan-binding protein, partial [Solirubrobacteraceae bacterium]|nr:peptidoglycan-binding protein [Solirubrobacteraceae bacterium]